MNPQELSQVVSIVISGIVCIFAILTFAFGRRKDSKETIQAMTRNDMKLDQIQETTDEIAQNVRDLTRKINEHDTEIAVIKRDLDTAFIRIDELKGKKS